MIKWIFISILAIFIVGIFLYYQNSSEVKNKILWSGYETRQIIIEGKELKLILADNPDRYQKGLMFVRKPVDIDGMIFKFPDQQIRSFWNMNTFEDLDIYWYNNGGFLGKSFLPSIEKSKTPVTVSSPSLADTVVEIIR